MPKQCRMENISTTFQERFRTPEGNVRIERIHPRQKKWMVHPRGGTSFVVTSKAAAVEQACALEAVPNSRWNAAARRVAARYERRR